MKCYECGGEERPATLETYDFSILVGLPLMLADVPGFQCAKCGYESVDGTVINSVLNMVAYQLTQLPYRLNGEQAKYLRKRLGWTQQQLAEGMDVNRVTVADWERGAHDISTHHDYILRGYVLTALAKQGLLGGHVPMFLNPLHREPPSADPTLPDALVNEMSEALHDPDELQKWAPLAA